MNLRRALQLLKLLFTSQGTSTDMHEEYSKEAIMIKILQKYEEKEIGKVATVHTIAVLDYEEEGILKIKEDIYSGKYKGGTEYNMTHNGNHVHIVLATLTNDKSLIAAIMFPYEPYDHPSVLWSFLKKIESSSLQKMITFGKSEQVRT